MAVLDGENIPMGTAGQPKQQKSTTLLMKKKRKIHISTEKKNKKSYSTETFSLIGLVIVAILNIHLHLKR